jgi:ribose transport system permease protein
MVASGTRSRSVRRRLGLLSSCVFGISATAYLAVLIALVIGYVLTQTPLGRRCYAVGSNPVAARLSGVATARIKAQALIAGATLASLATALHISRVGASDPTVGPEFLLPAFAAVFLGATMGISGRFSVLGTLVSIFVLAVGINGLQLIGVASWVEPVFNGSALLLALLLSRVAGNLAERTRS